MRALLTAVAATVLVAAGPVAAAHGSGGTGGTEGTGGPVGGERLGTGPEVVTDGSVPAPPAVKAASWLIADLDSGAVLAAKAPHARLRPASTLKTLTALVLLPRLDRRDVITGIDADAGIEGSKVGVYPGLRYSVDLLFMGLFLNSGNDAVHALARTDEGGVPATIRRMNAKAAQLGALDTHVVDPTGLDADGQLSSAYDLALISRAGLQRADFRRYATTRLAYYPDRTGGRYQISNQNHLLWSYPGALGVKTGFTTLARNTFVGAASRNGHRLVVTMMNSPHGVTRDAAALLDWGFVNRSALHPVGTLIKPAGGVRVPTATRESGDNQPPPPGPATPRVLTDRQIALTAGLITQIPVWLYAAPVLLVLMLILRPKAKAHRLRVTNRR